MWAIKEVWIRKLMPLIWSKSVKYNPFYDSFKCLKMPKMKPVHVYCSFLIWANQTQSTSFGFGIWPNLKFEFGISRPPLHTPSLVHPQYIASKPHFLTLSFMNFWGWFLDRSWSNWKNKKKIIKKYCLGPKLSHFEVLGCGLIFCQVFPSGTNNQVFKARG